MIEIAFAQKLFGAAVTLTIAMYKVLIARKKRQQQELKYQSRACTELMGALNRGLHPLFIQIAFAKLIGHREFSPQSIIWILGQPDPLESARRLRRAGDYVAPIEGGKLLTLTSVAANTIYRRTAIIVCLVSYISLDFPSLYHGLYVTAHAFATGIWIGVPATLSFCAMAAGAGVCALSEGGRLYAAAKLVAEQAQ